MESGDEFRITGIHLSYLHVCRRKLWLTLQGVQLERARTDMNLGQEKVATANTLQEASYRRRPAQNTQVQVAIPGFAAAIDYVDTRKGVVHEEKMSDRPMEAHRAQVCFYLWILRESGLGTFSGLLEFPKQKKREEVFLTEIAVAQLLRDFEEIRRISKMKKCPPVLHKPICNKCAFFDLCYIEEPSSHIF